MLLAILPTVLLKIYKALTGKKDRRWKIEHAQVLREQDFDIFKSGIIPSVQPTMRMDIGAGDGVEKGTREKRLCLLKKTT
jgi:predicted amidohydrolase YtcJ